MSAITTSDGDIVHYEVLGRGRAVVLIHGWLGSWRYWIPAMQQLHLKYRVYALDLFGFGDSAKNGKYGINHQVNMLMEFSNQLGLGKTAIIGHALGAWVAAEFAHRQPEKVARLMTISAPLFDTGDLDTRVPPNQLRQLNTNSFNARSAIQEAERGHAEPTIPSRPDLSEMLDSQATVRRSTSEIDKAALREAALQKGIQEGTARGSRPRSGHLTPYADAPNDNPNNPLYRKLGHLEPETLLGRTFRRTDSDFDKLRQVIARMDNSVIADSTLGYNAGHMLDIMRTLTCPLVLLQGTDDPIVDAPSDRVYDYIIGESKSVVPFPLPGVRHFPMLESDMFFRLVGSFLETQDVSKIAVVERWRRRSY